MAPKTQVHNYLVERRRRDIETLKLPYQHRISYRWGGSRAGADTHGGYEQQVITSNELARSQSVHDSPYKEYGADQR